MAAVLAAVNKQASQSWPQRLARALQHTAQALDLIQRQALAFDAVDSLVTQSSSTHAPHPPPPPPPPPEQGTPPVVDTTTSQTTATPTTVDVKSEGLPAVKSAAVLPAVKSASSASLGSLGSTTSDSAIDGTSQVGGAGGGAMRIESLMGLEALNEQGFALKSALMVGAASVLVAEASLAEEAAITAIEASDYVQLCITLDMPPKINMPDHVALEVKRGTPISDIAVELQKQLKPLYLRLNPTNAADITPLKVTYLCARTGTNPSQYVTLLDSCRIYPSSLHALISI